MRIPYQFQQGQTIALGLRSTEPTTGVSAITAAMKPADDNRVPASTVPTVGSFTIDPLTVGYGWSLRMSGNDTQGLEPGLYVVSARIEFDSGDVYKTEPIFLTISRAVA